MSEINISITLTDGESLKDVIAHAFGIGAEPRNLVKGLPPEWVQNDVDNQAQKAHAPTAALRGTTAAEAREAAVVDLSSGPIPEPAAVEVQGLTKAKVERLKKEVAKATPVATAPVDTDNIAWKP